MCEITALEQTHRKILWPTVQKNRKEKQYYSNLLHKYTCMHPNWRVKTSVSMSSTLIRELWIMLVVKIAPEKGKKIATPIIKDVSFGVTFNFGGLTKGSVSMIYCEVTVPLILGCLLHSHTYFWLVREAAWQYKGLDVCLCIVSRTWRCSEPGFSNHMPGLSNWLCSTSSPKIIKKKSLKQL